VSHRRAKLTPYGGRVLVDRVLVEGWSVGEGAKAASVSPATVDKWLGRYRDEGLVPVSRTERARRSGVLERPRQWRSARSSLAVAA
jgi:transposase